MNRSAKVVSLVDLGPISIVPIGLQMTKTCTVSVLLDVLIEWTCGCNATDVIAWMGSESAWYHLSGIA
jgi:hypothetical protein